jgi:hypothetical protein
MTPANRFTPCGIVGHPIGVDDLDFHLHLGDNLPTPDGMYECWYCPRNEDGSAVKHHKWATRTTDHLILMRTARADVKDGQFEWSWNLLTNRQRRIFIGAALRDGLDPRHLDDFEPKTLKLKATS